jgi:hypothetical protein
MSIYDAFKNATSLSTKVANCTATVAFYVTATVAVPTYVTYAAVNRILYGAPQYETPHDFREPTVEEKQLDNDIKIFEKLSERNPETNRREMETRHYEMQGDIEVIHTRTRQSGWVYDLAKKEFVQNAGK